MNINLSYNELLNFEESKDNPTSLKVKGISCKAGYISNKQFIIPVSELENIAKTLKLGIDGNGAYILKDHGGADIFSGPSVDTLVGRITNATAQDNVVMYEGRIEDQALAHKIRTKLVTASSVGLKVNNVFCSICGREYGDKDCTHILGREYPEESIHEMAKGYLDKPIAALVGKNMEGREQSIVLFPAIKGASVGMNFSEETEKVLSDLEKVKEQKLLEKDDESKECNAKEGANMAPKDIIIENNAPKDETFNKSLDTNNGEQTMTDELNIDKLTGEISTLKTNVSKLSEDLSTAIKSKEELDTRFKKLSEENSTLKEIVDKYKKEEEARFKAEIDALVVKLSELRKEKTLPDKDYKSCSVDVLRAEFELLSSLPKTSTKGEVAAEGGEDKTLALKENIRETIFKTRKDNKPVTNMRKW